MKRLLVIGVLLGLSAFAQGFSVGLDGGLYDDNFSGSLSLVGADPMFDQTPIYWRVGASYGSSDVLDEESVSPLAEESGYAVVAFLDGLYSVTPEEDPLKAGFYGGARLRYHNGDYEVSGEKLAQIDSSSFGLGAGAFAYYPLGKRAGLTLDLGLDYFFNQDIVCDDVYMDPETLFCEEIEDQRADSQTVFKARLGVSYAFGAASGY